MKETNKYKKELEKLDNYRLQMNGLCQKWLPREIMKNEEAYIDHGYDLYNHISYSLFEELVDKNEKMEKAIKEVMERNKNQILANHFLPKNESERELVNIFNGILKSINKFLSEALNDE